MDEARRLAEQGAGDKTLVWALAQAGGRGRRGRAWVSPPGNVYSSLLLRPRKLMPSQGTELSFLTAVAVAEALAGFLPASRHVACKWPNDILIDDAKCAGILLESLSGTDGLVRWIVVGVGINVASAPAGTEYPATSLASHGVHADIAAVLEAYIHRFAAWLPRWEEEGFAPLRAAWLGCAKGLGRPIRVRLDDRVIEGVFESIDESGALVLTKADGTFERILAGDVFPAL
jgi:BirA family biotin operon repressor/biotin-[acetyl-CoA-carboxylase] ligase